MHLSERDLGELREYAVSAAKEAGAFIQASVASGIEVQHKSGGSNIAAQVVTAVDLRADAIISGALRPTCAQYDLALLTEESTDDRARLAKDAFWSVDPLDGTLAFIESRPGYSVSIGLVARDGTPLIGVVYNPVTDILYSAVRGQGAQRQGESWRPSITSQAGRPFTLVFDRGFDQRDYYEHVFAALNELVVRHGFSAVQTLEGDGAAMNAIQVLENPPGCYFKFPKPQQGGGSLWDFAATAAIFDECGAVASDFYGQPLDLNRADSSFMNHRGVLYTTNVVLAAEIQGLLPIKKPR
ncbi:MAG TPA: inositol monophosphatase [Gammaproteobacteria bacterium]|nr:inositol monophosphatase [Gammaproteobacteria bacterium]